MCLLSSPEWRSRASARSQWQQDSVAFDENEEQTFLCPAALPLFSPIN